MLPDNLLIDVASVRSIEAVPTILEVVCRTTGMGFAAVARVTEKHWVACGVKDNIAFGLKPGGELKIETTICNEIREHRAAVIINHVAKDARFCDHHTPATYGFQSYIAMPILLKDGSFFGTLCAIDPRPNQLDTPEVIGMFRLFAELIAFHLNALDKIASSESRLEEAHATSELREQFIAVLGHDLRNPLNAVSSGAQLLTRMDLDERGKNVVGMIRESVGRIAELIDNILDFARGRLGGGVSLSTSLHDSLEPVIEQVVREIHVAYPGRTIDTFYKLNAPVICDSHRISQIISNLLGNALKHGDPQQPVRVEAFTQNGIFELSVANAGKPIPPAAMERLFLPFTRGEVQLDQQGLGLGLYIASEIAHAHSGNLTVVSNEKETQFTFTMPSGMATEKTQDKYELAS